MTQDKKELKVEYTKHCNETVPDKRCDPSYTEWLEQSLLSARREVEELLVRRAGDWSHCQNKIATLERENAELKERLATMKGSEL